MNFSIGENLEPVIENLEGVSIGVFLRQNKVKRNFRCSFCGKLVFQYEGDLALLMESADKPRDTGFTIHLCTRCRASYHVMW